MARDEAERKFEYVRTLVELAGADSRQVHFRVTAALAIPVLFVTQLPFERLEALDTTTTWIFFGGLAAMIAGALCFFQYSSQGHHLRLDLAECLLTLDADKAKRLRRGLWTRNRWAFWCGNVLSVVGVALLAYVLGVLLDV